WKYEQYFGGVCAFSKLDFLKVNGFSNEFWGWGGEDDDMYRRVRNAKLKLIRYPITMARYRSLNHTLAHPERDRGKVVLDGINRYHNDGLTSLKYVVRKYELKPLYTWMLVDVGQGKNMTLIAQIDESLRRR
ncbi:PREDICTED: beta-1,4-N-acetylgalactosaminyltransferase bre-4-like, partial [Priapulus caudatus]|uniref:Beta-1,4-N-acetylgalactosaminyltransferase bre-4-like n=1 Tax=Priapulus caudatus TaxID=37621 RepID=A0ABM1EW16_PRICU